ncbi:HipA domain-containing protein, partial [Chryseobacterium sp.]|uniref:HipA domain-containing protein n=1 Tax=Chryseobacterium sp. TaxID=1871047 RepID=UPI002FC5AF2D
MQQVIQMFRLMVFNIVISKRDDHAKNFSFQHRDENWKLSPAYDLLPSSGFNGYHTPTINGQGEPTLKDVTAIASEIGLAANQAKEIIEQVRDICHQNKMAKFNLRNQ